MIDMKLKENNKEIERSISQFMKHWGFVKEKDHLKQLAN